MRYSANGDGKVKQADDDGDEYGVFDCAGLLTNRRDHKTNDAQGQHDEDREAQEPEHRAMVGPLPSGFQRNAVVLWLATYLPQCTR